MNKHHDKTLGQHLVAVFDQGLLGRTAIIKMLLAMVAAGPGLTRLPDQCPTTEQIFLQDQLEEPRWALVAWHRLHENPHVWLER